MVLAIRRTLAAAPRQLTEDAAGLCALIVMIYLGLSLPSLF